MDTEILRPDTLDKVIGHTEVKKILTEFLSGPVSQKSIILTGPPGIGKTTLVLAAAKTFGYDPIEINASKSIRSYDDVQKIIDSCSSSTNIYSFLKGDQVKTCIILDEVDGSDPHAQEKIIGWIKSPSRKVHVLCTGNDLPAVFKRNSANIINIKCYPPEVSEIRHLFNINPEEYQNDIRKIINKIQYETSDIIPKYSIPPTGMAVEKTFILKQKMFGLDDPLHEYHAYKQDTLQKKITSS